MSTEERTFDLAVNSTAGAIASNISELKSYIESVTQPYIGQVITEDQAKFAKKDLASLRKLQTELEDERKRAKAIIMAPYSEFEKLYKDAVKSLDDAIAGIDKQVKEIEANAKAARERELKEFILKSVYEITGNKLRRIFDSRPEIMTWFFRPEWLNASAARTSVERTIREKIVQVARDIDSVETSAGDEVAVALDEYYRTGSLSSAILKAGEVARLKQQSCAMTAEQPPAEERQEEEASKQIAPVAERIFFDIPVEPDDKGELEVLKVPVILEFPKYKKPLVREIMTKVGIKMAKPSGK